MDCRAPLSKEITGGFDEEDFVDGSVCRGGRRQRGCQCAQQRCDEGLGYAEGFLARGDFERGVSRSRWYRLPRRGFRWRRDRDCRELDGLDADANRRTDVEIFVEPDLFCG